MTQTVEAIYENGILRPVRRLEGVEEHARVRLTVEIEPPGVAAPKREPKAIWEIAQELVEEIPEDVRRRLPVDGAEQHDHYIYGTPKQP